MLRTQLLSSLTTKAYFKCHTDLYIVDHILGKFGTFIVERIGTDIEDAISNLQPYKENIYVIQQLIRT